MALCAWLLLWLLAPASSGAVNNCHPGCHCDVESFGLFDSFSLTRVDCQGLGPGITMPVAIPLDTTHLDLSFNAMGPLTNTMLAGPGYTTLVSLDLSNNHITKVSGGCPHYFRQYVTLVSQNLLLIFYLEHTYRENPAYVMAWKDKIPDSAVILITAPTPSRIKSYSTELCV